MPSEFCAMENHDRNRRNKQILLALASLFLVFVLYTTWDIMSKTTHPGARKHLPNSILK